MTLFPGVPSMRQLIRRMPNAVQLVSIHQPSQAPFRRAAKMVASGGGYGPKTGVSVGRVVVSAKLHRCWLLYLLPTFWCTPSLRSLVIRSHSSWHRVECGRKYSSLQTERPRIHGEAEKTSTVSLYSWFTRGRNLIFKYHLSRR